MQTFRYFWHQIQVLEIEFQNYFIGNKSNGIHPLINYLSAHYPDIPNRIIKTFIRTRLFIKLKFQQNSNFRKRNPNKIRKFLP